jgi:2-keto-3-deoxy-L-rhamnonate aldolase RhmA
MLMAATDPFSARLKRGETFGLAWLALGSPAAAELALAAGAGALVIDLQHGLWDRHALEAAVGRSGPVPVIARVEENAAPAVSRALDSGADAVLVPLVDTAEEAAAAVAAARFPPAGRRSGGGVRPLGGGFGAYLARAGEIAVGVMIETAAGVENAEAIAATPGLDFVLIGTGDLGLSYAGAADPAAAREDGCRRVLAACRAAGLPCGIFTMDAAQASARRAEGYALTVVANDIEVVRGGFAAAVAAFGTPAP